MERSGDDVAGGDSRTLSFAAYRIDAALLEKLLRYERALLENLPESWSPAAMASAHRLALASSGLSQDVVERALAVLRRFAGNREVAARLRARAGSLDPERAGVPLAPEQLRDAAIAALRAEGLEVVLWQSVPLPAQTVFQRRAVKAADDGVHFILIWRFDKCEALRFLSIRVADDLDVVGD